MSSAITEPKSQKQLMEDLQAHNESLIEANVALKRQIDESRNRENGELVRANEALRVLKAENAALAEKVKSSPTVAVK